ncbi:MAG: hypothetical protein KIT45_04775 [Fimbriimonadia bacterium]|nr:hypothetical protein [Fimbriimonadia bacterium]
MKRFSFASLMLLMLGCFNLLSALGTFVPSFVKDRVNKQFIPVWENLLSPLSGGQPSESAVRNLAVISQWIIGTWELVMGCFLIAAAFLPARRVPFSNVGLGMALAIFSVFTFVTFGTHDERLPHWDQYPQLMIWVAAVWIVVHLSESGDSKST